MGLIALLTLDSMYHRWVSGLVCSLEFCKCVCVCLCMFVCLRVVYVCECVSFCCLFLIASVCVCARKYILIFLPQ